MKRYEYTDNPIEDILEDLYDGFVHKGSWAKKLSMRPFILFVSVALACLTAVACGYGSAWFVVACIQRMPPVSNFPLLLAIPVALFAIGIPIGSAIVSFSIVRQYAYMTLRRRLGDPCDDRVIIPVRILNDLLV